MPITQCASVGESSAANGVPVPALFKRAQPDEHKIYDSFRGSVRPGRFEQKTSEGKMHKLALSSIQRGLISKVHQQAQADRSSDDAEV